MNIEDRIKRWREDDEEGYCGAIELLCDAEEELRRLRVPWYYANVLEERIKLALCNKLPGYVRFSQWFDKTYKVDSLTPGWLRAIQRQHGWWHVQDERWTVGVAAQDGQGGCELACKIAGLPNCHCRGA